ncbi:MAG: plasmid recombination protein [Bacteroidales bacterium]|nr:plasmid recombination protein [Bacteroidales bacterium]
MSQYVVIHMEKRMEITPVLERHILRVEVKYVEGQRVETVWMPDNADANRAMMNRELVSRIVTDPLTGEKKHLTINQAIRKRIEDAGIKKIHKGQNLAIEIILTGSPETMNKMNEKQLDRWVKESMDWAGEQWGKENIVTAVLHMDEKTPHIHLIVVPIVQGLSRTSKKRDEERRRSGKEVKARPRNTRGNRLAANEVFTVPKLYAYHSSYAEKVGAHFGLGRGIKAEKGSKKKHQTSEDYNRQLERERISKESLIEDLTSEYSSKQEALLTINESLALAAANLQKVSEDAANEEERRNKAKKEADDQEARYRTTKQLTEALEGSLEQGRNLEKQIAKREGYLRSIASKSLWDLLQKIPELIKKELTLLVNKYIKGEVVSFKEEELAMKGDKGDDKKMFMRMDFKWEGDGKNYKIDVRESDGLVWLNQKQWIRKNGTPFVMPEVADYCTRSLSPEGKALVTSLYRKTEFTPRKEDPVVLKLQEKYGDVAVDSVTPLRTDGKETGRMYHFTTSGRNMTAVCDYEAKSISLCAGHARKGALYMENWKTLGGKPAVAVYDRVISLEYKRLHRGRGV